MSDRLTAWVRTVTPKLWGAAVTALLAWLAAHAPWALELLDLLEIDLTSPVVVGFVVLAVDIVVTAAWHWVWTRLQPYLPDGVVRLVLGSAASPLYVRSGEVAAVAPQGSTITVDGDA